MRPLDRLIVWGCQNTLKTLNAVELALPIDLLHRFAVSASGVSAKDELPRTTHDGLDLIKNTKLRAVYMQRFEADDASH